MEREAFDRLARAFGRAGSRRATFGLAFGGIAAALGAKRVEAAAFDRDCTRFILSAGNRRTTEFEHVDDDLEIELQRKGSRHWKTIYLDDDGTANENGKHASPVKFRAQVGDKIRITATNGAATAGSQACELDEIWLFCDDRNSRGKRVFDGYDRTEVGSGNCRVNGVFVSETFRIKP